MSNLSAVVDRLAMTLSRIAELEREAAKLKAELALSGQDRIAGTLHNASISQVAGRVSIDWRAIAERMSPSRQLIAAHTKVGEPSVQVRLHARKDFAEA